MSSLSHPSDQSGSSPGFGKYKLIASLGTGGMAEIFLAVAQGQLGFNKLQVIKRVRPELIEEPEFVAMFLDEARLAARLNHPNVVQTNEVGDVGGHYFMAMEYLDGQPLNRIMSRAWREKRVITREALLAIVSDALAGLHYAHELTDFDGSPLHVIHRDASPDNIFVTYDGQTKVLDFGIAKAAIRTAETSAGIVKGKVAYIAPEQATGDVIDRRADIFTIGVLLFEIATGAQLWKGMADLQIVDRIMRGKIPRPRELDPDVPAELDAICARAMAASPGDRYPTATALRSDLLTYLHERGYRGRAEDIGASIAGAFQGQREEIKATIERQLRAMKSAHPAPFAAIGVTLDAPRSSTPPPLSNRHAMLELPRLLPSLPPPISEPPPQSGARISISEKTPSPSTLVPLRSQPPPAEGASAKSKGRGRTTIAAFATAALLVGAVGAAILVRGKGPQTALDSDVTSGAAGAALATTAIPSSPGVLAPTAPAMIELRVTVEPRDALIYLDDTRLSNPFTARFHADGSGHRLRVEAHGYSTQSRMLVFEKEDIAIELSLSPSVHRPETATTAAEQTGVKNQPEEAPPQDAPGKPAKQKLEPGDPWAH